MLGLLAAAIVFQGPQTLSQRIGIRPTGKNGYEEYLLAAELVSTREASLLLRWTPGMTLPQPAAPGSDAALMEKPPTAAERELYALLPKLSPLDVRREAANRLGKALDLIAAGNAKPVADPRAEPDPETLFPEFAAFRAVTRLAVFAAQVYAADGHTDRATNTLLDQLVFADNFGRGLIISNLVSVSSTNIALAGFGELMPRLSRTDAMRIQAQVRALLERPLSLRSVWPAESAFSLRTLSAALTAKVDPSKTIDAITGEDQQVDPQTKRFSMQFAKLTPPQRQDLMRSIQQKVEGRNRIADRILSGPEKGWIPGFVDLAAGSDDPPTTLADYLLSLVSPTFTQFIVAATRTRTQLRLLALHAKLAQYRWDYGRYPSSLNEIDPLSGQPYVYELQEGGSLRLASKGTKETGEIELKYQRKSETPEVNP